MKKILIVLSSIIIFFMMNAVIASYKKNEQQEIKAVYISYLEYLNNFQGNPVSVNKTYIDKMIDNIKYYQFNTILLHVSPFCDAIYDSKIFPYSYTLSGKEGKYPGFDYLEYFIKVCHQKSIKVHAWINPYRINNSKDVSKISRKNPAYLLLHTSHVSITSAGIHFNPASEIVSNLIISQVDEIINNYNIDGIHFDDYFYTDQKIDNVNYQEYLKEGGELSLSDYRLNNTNNLIKSIYSLIKDKDPTIIFSISPDGNINNNYKYHYADVKTWLSNDGYVDIIMPQIYYGMENEYLPFEVILSKWHEMTTNSNIKITPILAFYKVGLKDDGAGSGQNEWLNNNSIISRQIELTKKYKNNYGYGLFRYDYIFNKNIINSISIEELNNIKE